MYIDSHFHLTYIVARMAGFNQNDARIVAYASQQVDDNFTRIDQKLLKFSDSSLFSNRWTLLPISTVGWEKIDTILYNACPAYVFDTWFMYHFIAPCFKGNGSIDDKITTPATDDNGNPTNPMAWNLIDYVQKQKTSPYGLHMLGAALHMFCDTYSHQQFVGEYNEINRPTADANGNTIYSLTSPTEPFNQTDQATSNKLNDNNYLFTGGGIGHAIALDLPDRPNGNYNWNRHIPVDGQTAVSRPNYQQWLNCISAVYKIMRQYLGATTNLTMVDSQLQAFEAVFNNAPQTFAAEDYTKRANIWLNCIRNGFFTTDSGMNYQTSFPDAGGNSLFNACDGNSTEPNFIDYIGVQWFIDALNQAQLANPPYNFYVPSDALAYYTGYYTELNIRGQISQSNASFDRTVFNTTNFALFMSAVDDIYNQMLAWYKAAHIKRPELPLLEAPDGTSIDDLFREFCDKLAPTQNGNWV